MTRPKTRLAVAVAALAALSACSAADTPSAAGPETTGSPTPAEATPSETSDPSGPKDLAEFAEGAALPAGRYRMLLIGDRTESMHVIVDVPEGYFAPGPYVVDDGHGEIAPDEFGEVAVYAATDVVYANPCLRGKLIDPGESVRDLAGALVAQKNRTTTKPKSAILDGYRGLYLESTSSMADPRRCDSGSPSILGSHTDDAFGFLDNMDGIVSHLWIMNVEGRRVVVIARTYPGHTAHPAELVGIAKSAQFRLG